MHFGTKSYLKSTRNHTAKHATVPASINVSLSEVESSRGAKLGLFIRRIKINIIKYNVFLIYYT